MDFIASPLYQSRVLDLNGPIFQLLFFLVIIWSVGLFFKRIGLPIMFGEMLAGLILGPPILNIIQPNAHIEWLAEIGVFTLVFFTGMEIDIKKLRKTTRQAFWVAFGGTLIPFLTGFWITLFFNGTVYQGLFIGLATAVTSIATKSRILHEIGLARTKLGHMLANAAILDNIFALILFTGVISIVNLGRIAILPIIKVAVSIGIFFFVIILVGYYLFPRFVRLFSHKGASGFTFALMVALLFGLFAELCGIHFIVGVFLAGIFVRKEVMESTELFNRLFDSMYAISYGFLGPLFFITLSFHVNFKILFSELLPFFFVLMIGAILGKVFGAGIFAWFTGYSPKQSVIIGAAMNGRGMMEIIMVVVAIEMGIFDERIVSVLVLIAMMTTLITPLVLRLLIGRTRRKVRKRVRV